MKYQFYAIVYDVAGNQVSSKSAASPLSITTSIQLTTSLTLDPASNKTIKLNETFNIKATLSPTNVNNKNVNWSTSDSSVATVSATTTTTGASITVTGKKVGTATITATPQDGQSSCAKSITVTVYKPTLLAQVTTSNYGDYVNYPISIAVSDNKIGGASATGGTETPKTDWRIFYKDDNYVYLISTNYFPNSKKPSNTFYKTNGDYGVGWASSSSSIPSATVTNKTNFLFSKLSRISTSSVSYKATATLLDTNKWSVLVNSTYADAAIGSPTIEMFAASWNAVNPSKKLYYDSNSSGYTYGTSESNLLAEGSLLLENSNNTLYFPHKALWNSMWGYWFASPTSNGRVLGILYNGEIFPDYAYDAGRCVRPIVALKSTILGEKDIDGIWQLSVD